MAQARAQFRVITRDTAGNIPPAGTTVTICKPGTTTPIADSLYASETSGTPLTSVTTDAAGYVEVWADIPGTDVPGFVRVFRSASPAIDQEWPFFPHPLYVYPGGKDHPWIDVRLYGAKADGSDDSTAIQAALNAVPSVTGGTVYFPAGVYSVQSTLTVATAGTRLLGSGHSAGDSSDLYSTIKANPATGQLTDVVDVTAPDCEIAFLQIDGATTDATNKATNALTVSGDDFKLFACGIKRAKTLAFNLTGARARIHACRFVQVSAATTIGGNVKLAGADHIMADCFVVGGGNTTAVLEVAGSGAQISNCHVTGPAGSTGAAANTIVGGARSRLVNCVFDTVGPGPMIKVTASRVTIADSLLFIATAPSPAQPVIDATNNSAAQLKVIGCTSQVTGTGQFNDFILLGTTTPDAVVVVGNNIGDCTNIFDMRPGTFGENAFLGKPTRAGGSAAFSASTTKAVTHGLAAMPAVVLVTPTTNRTLWVTNVGASSFTVHAAASNSDTFYWEAWV